MPFCPPFKRTVKHQPPDWLPAHGLMHHDPDALTSCQRECNHRLSMTVQLEQESYLSQHPEISAMLELFYAKMVRKRSTTSGFLKEGVNFFTRPTETLDQEIRERLGIGPDEPYNQGRPGYIYKNKTLEMDLHATIKKYHQSELWSVPSSEKATPTDTVSSSFISARSSDTTLPTPDPVPTPPPTLSEAFGAIISNLVDKAIYLHVDEHALRYDFAYAELARAVEEAMEIPVFEIRQDIAQLFFNAYQRFELNILEKERIAAEIAWGKRMRKKMKRMIRRQDNFKGWQTPPTPPESEPSSHESYLKPPQRPCECHPQFRYNRYAKDRYGIYLPRAEEYCNVNVTITPDIVSIDTVDMQKEAQTQIPGK